MITIKKRNGEEVDFSLAKIKSAIEKAFTATNTTFNDEILDMLALKVTANFQKKIVNSCINVEDIQDSVEIVLAQSGYEEAAKAYILYRKQHEKNRNMESTVLDYKKLVDSYVKVEDWRVKENSTVTYSVGGLILSNSGAVTANYWLSEIYDEEIAKAHKNADIHIHDLSMLTGYCFTGDTKVKTLDGKNPSFKELVDNNVKEFWVYAYDGEKIIPAKAINPRITRKTDKLIKVTLCNKTEIKCTPDHLFMLRDGTYCKACDLKPNVSLMPLYIGEKNKGIMINVCKVKTIELETPIEVYDLTVPKYENFAIDGGVFVHNCAGWSLKQLIKEGLGGVDGRICSAPAKHLSVLCNQMVNFLGIMQNEWAGAQAFSSFDTYLAPFVKVDNLSYAEVKKCIESFVFGVNIPSRWGTQAPFSNITLDWVVPNDLANLPCIVGGQEMMFCYKDCKKEMDMINKAFLEIMIEGDANGRGFQYPMKCVA